MFIGRKNEIKQLNQSLNSDKSELIVVYGRRRVGKTYLIQYVNNFSFDFSHTGLYKDDIKLNNNDNINSYNKKSFCESLIAYKSNISSNISDWYIIFAELRKLLLSLNKDVVKVFIDELPWIANNDKDFLSAFAQFYNSWNNYTPKLLKVFVCGSATSFLYKNFFQNPKELYKRETRRVLLSPFSLNECEEYFNARNFGYSKLDVFYAYSVFGGMPYYFDLFDNGLSALQNIDYLYFGKNAKLLNEYKELVDTFFSSSKYYQLIFEFLYEKKQGLERGELIKKLDISDNEYISTILNNLIQCDFILKYEPLYKNNNRILYKLKDQFLLFHFYFKKFQNQQSFFTKNINTPIFNTWMGLTFERTVFNHIDQIKTKLGISAVNTKESSFKGTAENIGTTQIDLLVDRADNVVNLCEVKYTSSPFVIDSSLISDFNYKELIFNKCTKNNKTIQYTLITTFEVIPNNFFYRINSYITLDDLFIKLNY